MAIDNFLNTYKMPNMVLLMGVGGWDRMPWS